MILIPVVINQKYENPGKLFHPEARFAPDPPVKGLSTGKQLSSKCNSQKTTYDTRQSAVALSDTGRYHGAVILLAAAHALGPERESSAVRFAAADKR